MHSAPGATDHAQRERRDQWTRHATRIATLIRLADVGTETRAYYEGYRVGMNDVRDRATAGVPAAPPWQGGRDEHDTARNRGYYDGLAWDRPEKQRGPPRAR